MSLQGVWVAGGIFALALVAAQAESVILKQGFNDFDLEAAGVVGDAAEEGGAWGDLHKTATAPRISEEEFYAANGESKGKSIVLTRDNTVTMDFWLVGSWSAPLDSGKVRVSFRIFRDSADSSLSVHFGDAAKNIGANTVAVSIGNRMGGEVLRVMDAEGVWQGAGTNPAVGNWAQITLDIDFAALTYSVLLDGEVAVEKVPFVMSNPAVKLSFLPGAPEGNVTYIDDVAIVAID
jgi:hypothetical protein